MSDENKSYDPSAKRLEDARRKGEVAVSAEMRHAVMLLAILAVGLMACQSFLERMASVTVDLWSGAGELRVHSLSAHAVTAALLTALGSMLAPVFTILVLGAASVAFVQGRPTLAWSRLAPQWKKLSPVAGAKRMFGPAGLVEFCKTLAKCAGVLLVSVIILQPALPMLERSTGMEPERILPLAGELLLIMFKPVLLLVGALAAADFVYQHRSFLRRMRMSLQDLRDEQKESDGDPAVKARQRQLGVARTRQRMMAAVPEASVVVTNPTHYAVALRYEHGAMRAPIVVAKGTDLIALRIREIAAEYGVAVVESPPLARALYASAEVDRPIPIEHYAAVAEIISYVLGLARNRRPA